jgi:probable phosphoglycerate mutase
MSLTLYFLRHGQTSCSRDNVFCGSGLNPELTPEGRAMAQAFADAYRDTAWRAIYTSPAQRARATAQPLCHALDIEPQVRDDLREIAYGQWEGQTVETVSRDFHDDHLRWSADPAWNAPTGGEAAVVIAQRVLHVIEEVRQSHDDGNVLLVSHKATIRIAICALLGIDVGRFRYRLGCPVGSVSIVEFGAHGPLLHALANRTHLSEELRTLPGT